MVIRRLCITLETSFMIVKWGHYMVVILANFQVRQIKNQTIILGRPEMHAVHSVFVCNLSPKAKSTLYNTQLTPWQCVRYYPGKDKDEALSHKLNMALKYTNIKITQIGKISNKSAYWIVFCSFKWIQLHFFRPYTVNLIRSEALPSPRNPKISCSTENLLCWRKNWGRY